MGVESYSDGSGQNWDGYGAASFIIVKDNYIMHQESTLLKDHTNNMAEYEALTLAVSWLLEHTRGDITCYVDSQLVANQVTGTCQVLQPNLVIARAHLMNLIGDRVLGVNWVPRSNKFIREADRLNRQTVKKAMVNDQ